MKKIWPKQTDRCLTFHLIHLNILGTSPLHKKCRGRLRMDHQFNLQNNQMHTHSCMHAHTRAQEADRFRYQWVCTNSGDNIISLCTFSFIFASPHLLFTSLHLQETAHEILIMMRYQGDVLRLPRGGMCVCIGVLLGACVLPANDPCFRDLLPSFSPFLSSLRFRPLSPLILYRRLLFPSPLSPLFSLTTSTSQPQMRVLNN